MSNTYVINPIVSLDGAHVMSQSDDYVKLTEFFSYNEYLSVMKYK